MRYRSILFFLIRRPPPRSTLFPYTTLFRSRARPCRARAPPRLQCGARGAGGSPDGVAGHRCVDRSEEHTSELQSHVNLVCRLLLEKKNTNNVNDNIRFMRTLEYAKREEEAL